MTLKPLPRKVLDVVSHGDQRAIRWFEELLPAALNSLTGIPAGGTTGQALVKTSNADYATAWQTVSGGGGVTDGDKGDVVVSGGGTIWTIDAAVTAADRARANHTGTQTASTISDFSEAVDDRVASLLVAGTNITLTYNDAGNSLTIDAAGGSGPTAGTALVDFGAGGVIGTVNVSGQAGLGAGDPIRVWIQGDASADYNAYTHSRVLSRAVGLSVENVTAGSGFDIIAASELTLKGVIACRWQWG